MGGERNNNQRAAKVLSLDRDRSGVRLANPNGHQRSDSKVPGAGFEPARPLGQRLLRPPRLPFRHPGPDGIRARRT